MHHTVMKKQHIYMAVAIMAGLIGVALLPWGSRSSEETSTIGAILPMTGGQALTGQEMSRGMLLAMELINLKPAGKPSIRLLIEDSKGQPKDAVAAARKLLDVDGARDIAVSLTGPSRAVIPLVPTNAGSVVTFSMDETLTLSSLNAVRIYPGILEEGRAMVRIVEQLSPKRVAVLSFDQEAINMQVDKVLMPFLTSRSIEAVNERFAALDGGQLRAVVERVQAFRPTTLILNAYYNQIPAVLTVLSESGLDVGVQLVGGLNMAMAVHSGEILNPQRREVYLAIPAYLYASRYGNNGGAIGEFSDKYRAKWGAEPTLDAAYAFDGVMALAAAIREGNTDNESTAQVLRRMSEFRGATGTLRIDGSGSSASEWVLVSVDPSAYPYSFEVLP